MKKIAILPLFALLLAAIARGQDLDPMPKNAVFANRTQTNGTVIVSAEHPTNPDERGWALFDGTSNTKWLAYDNKGWIVYQFANGERWAVTNYVLWTANDAPERDPNEWRLEGSNDLAAKIALHGPGSTAVNAATWVEVDYQNKLPRGRLTPDYRQPASFPCEQNVIPYNAYRLNILANAGAGDRIQFSEWEMQGHSGYSRASVLVVEGEPQGLGEVEPPFGNFGGLEPGTNIAASAKAVWTNTAENVIAVPAGWGVSFWDDVEKEYVATTNNSTLAFTYVHPMDAPGRIVWTFAVSNLFTATAPGAGGSVTGAGWHNHTNSVTLTPAPDPDYEFFRWTGDIAPVNRYDDPLVFPPGSGPREVVAEFIPAGAAGNTRYVAEDGEDGNTGFFPDDAKRSIAAAVADLPDGGLVLVAPGQYWVYGRNPVEGQIVLDRAITVRGTSGDPAETRVTLLENDPWNIILHVLHQDARVENLTFANARSFDHNNRITAGVISNCVFTAGRGGSNPDKAGGIRIDGGLVTHSVIRNNTNNNDDNNACGVRITGGRLEHSLIVDNSAGGNRAGFTAGIRASGGGVVLNCTVVRNSSLAFGGVHATGDARVINTVIAGNNTALGNPNPDHAAWGGDAACFTNCFTDTLAAINEWCFNYPADILLADIANNDFAPAPGSPAVGAVTPVANIPGVDLAGNPRAWGGAMSAGCYEPDPFALKAVFLAGPKTGIATRDAPLRVTFTALVAGTNGNETLRYTWDFGDGETAVVTGSPDVFHDYALGKIYTVSLTVTNLSAHAEAAVKTCPNLLHCAAPTLYVWNQNTDPLAIPAPPFDGWSNAALSVQAAVNQAIGGCEIVIRAGNYPNTDGNGVNVEKALRIYGENENPAEVVLRYTGFGGRALRLDHPGAWVSGVTLQDGLHTHGSGVLIEKYGGTVSNCVLRAGTSNYGSRGAGAYLNSADALLTHSVIKENRVATDTDYSIVYINAGRVENCLVTANYLNGAGGVGASVFDLRNDAVVRNCTIVANTNLTRAVFAFNGANTLAEHNVAAANGAHTLFTGSNRLINNTVDSAHGLPSPEPNLRFGAPEIIFKDFHNADYRLGPASPAINAGPFANPAEYPSIDLDGQPRVQGGRIDHGCHEARPRATLFMVR